jgi:Zn-dependent protease/CBS domain-containing protein
MRFFKTWSIPLGKYFGVDFRLHASFFFLVVFVLAAALAPKGGGALKGALLIGSILLALFIHEAAHMLAAARRRMLPRMNMLLPFGGVHLRDAAESSRPPAPHDEIAVALAGPLANLLLAAGTALAILVWMPGAQLANVPYLDPLYPGKSFVWINLFLATLNLVPAYPLDGGRVLRVLLTDTKSFDPRQSYKDATRRVVTMGQVFAVFLIFAGVVIAHTGLMFIGFLLFLGVQLEDRSLLFQTVIEAVRLEEVMLTEFATLSPADTLQDALDKAVHSLQDDFPVVRGADLVGVISKQTIVAALRDGNDGYVQSAMKRAFEIGSRNDSLAAAFRKLTSGNPVLPIVENERLIGIVTLQNLMHSMGLLAESRKLRRE